MIPLLPADSSTPPVRAGKCLGWAGGICFLSAELCSRPGPSSGLGLGAGPADVFSAESLVFPIRLEPPPAPWQHCQSPHSHMEPQRDALSPQEAARGLGHFPTLAFVPAWAPGCSSRWRCDPKAARGWPISLLVLWSLIWGVLGHEQFLQLRDRDTEGGGVPHSGALAVPLSLPLSPLCQAGELIPVCREGPGPALVPLLLLFQGVS